MPLPFLSRAQPKQVAQPLIVPVNIGEPSMAHLDGQFFVDNPGSWEPEALAFEYQWLADGVPIEGADQHTYSQTADDWGKLLSCRVTAVGTGGSSAPVETANAIEAVPQPPDGYVKILGPFNFASGTDGWSATAGQAHGGITHDGRSACLRFYASAASSANHRLNTPSFNVTAGRSYWIKARVALPVNTNAPPPGRIFVLVWTGDTPDFAVGSWQWVANSSTATISSPVQAYIYAGTGEFVGANSPDDDRLFVTGECEIWESPA